jgi:hypothetical protein
MASFCPRFSTLSDVQKIALFSVILDIYIHGLPLDRRYGMPVPNPKTMSPKELEELKLEYGKLVPFGSRDELYAAIGRFDEAQIDLKAREMLHLFQRGPVSPAELHALLNPPVGNKADPSEFLKWILSGLRFCRVNP